jgi:hypothetical protein
VSSPFPGSSFNLPSKQKKKDWADGVSPSDDNYDERLGLAHENFLLGKYSLSQMFASTFFFIIPRCLSQFFVAFPLAHKCFFVSKICSA